MVHPDELAGMLEVHQAITACSTSSGMSKLAYTFCTSSWSSNASTTRSTARAADSSDSATVDVGNIVRSPLVTMIPASSNATRTAWRSVGARRDLPRVAGVDDVLGTGVERREHEVVLGDGVVLEDDHALALELPRHRAGLGHRPAVAAEDVLDLAAVRLRLSVRHSTNTATPLGA